MDVPPGTVDTGSRAPTIAAVLAEVSGRELAGRALEWPADVFALVGTVLRRTHAYRFAVSPPAGRHWPPRGGAAWNDAVCRRRGARGPPGPRSPTGPPPALVAEAWAVLREGASATLDDVARRTRLAGLRGAAHAARGQRRGLRRAWPPRSTRCGRRATGSAAGRRSCWPAPGRCPASRPYRLRVLPKVRTPPGGHLLPLAVALPVPARPVGRRRAGTRRPPGGPDAGRSRRTSCCCRGRCGSGSATSGPVPGRCTRVGERTVRHCSSSTPPSRSTSTWSSASCVSALDEVDVVDAVVLPESALPAADVQPLEALLARYGVTVLLAGARETGRRRPAGCPPTGCTSACTSAAAGRTTGRTSTTAGSSTRARSTSTTWRARSIPPCAGGRRWRCPAARSSSSSSARA